MNVVSMDEGRTAEPIEGVTLTILAGADRTNAQHFEIEPGAEVPVHSHEHEQVGQIFEGTLTFVRDDEAVEVGPGDTYAIPSNEPHGARNDGGETVVGIEMFSPPRLNPDWAPDE
jgi:quercetin dioxygenase-like cupin family protein